GFLEMPRATDIAIEGSLAYIGDTDRIHVVDLSSPSGLESLGDVGKPGDRPDVNMGGWLAVGNIPDSGSAVFSTGRSIEPGQTAPNAGVRLAALRAAVTFDLQWR